MKKIAFMIVVILGLIAGAQQVFAVGTGQSWQPKGTILVYNTTEVQDLGR